MKILCTKKEAAKRVVELLRAFYLNKARDLTIGINIEGRVDFWYNHQNDIRNMAVASMAFPIHNTEETIIFHNNEDPTDPNTWKDNNFINGLIQDFTKEWIDNSLQLNGEGLPVVWKED